MRRQQADSVCFGNTLGLILVPKSVQNRSQANLNHSKSSLGSFFSSWVRSGGAPGVPWEGLGRPGPHFGMVVGSQIHTKSIQNRHPKPIRLWKQFFKDLK